MTDVRQTNDAGHGELELDEQNGAGVRATVRMLADALSQAVLCASRPPIRAAVRVEGASIEVEWPAPTTAPELTTGQATTQATGAPAATAATAPELAGDVVRSALVGTFYRAPEPGAKPFVEVGDFVEPGRQLAIVEAMKLMNPVLATVSGRVVELLAGDGEPVEYDQPLLVIEPGDDEPGDDE